MSSIEAIIYLVSLVLALLLPLIPATIAKRKYRSFWLFYILGLFLFIPMLVIALCIGNKYDDEVLSKGGIKILIAAVASILLISPIINLVERPVNAFVENNLDLWAADSILEVPESHIIFMGVGILLVALLISFLLVLIIVTILGKLVNVIIDAINNENVSNKQEKIHRKAMNYNGKNAHHVRRLNMVIPIAKKYESFFNKRDKLAKYQTLSLGRVLKIALPVPLICTYLLSTVWFAYWRENHPSWYPFDGPGKLLLIVFCSLFFLLVLLSKPIANLKYKKSLKYDRIDAERGYTRDMQAVLPELQDKIFRYKTLRNMRMVLKMDLTNDIGKAACFALLLNKGIAIGKVAALASVPIVAGSVLFDYLKDSVKDPYMPQ